MNQQETGREKAVENMTKEIGWCETIVSETAAFPIAIAYAKWKVTFPILAIIGRLGQT